MASPIRGRSDSVGSHTSEPTISNTGKTSTGQKVTKDKSKGKTALSKIFGRSTESKQAEKTEINLEAKALIRQIRKYDPDDSTKTAFDKANLRVSNCEEQIALKKERIGWKGTEGANKEALKNELGKLTKELKVLKEVVKIMGVQGFKISDADKLEDSPSAGSAASAAPAPAKLNVKQEAEERIKILRHDYPEEGTKLAVYKAKFRLNNCKTELTLKKERLNWGSSEGAVRTALLNDIDRLTDELSILKEVSKMMNKKDFKF